MRHQLSIIGVLASSLVLTGSIDAAAQDQRRNSTQNTQISDMNQRVSSAIFATSAQQQAQSARPDRPRRVAIDWDQARADIQRQTLAQQRLTTAIQTGPVFILPRNDAAARASATRLPVLMPRRDALRLPSEPLVLLFPQADFFTLSITGDDILIEVFGTRLAHAEAPDPASGRRLRAVDGDGFRTGLAEYGVEVNFNRYGAAYSITVECDNPIGDPRCTQVDYARDLARNLGIIAGSPDEGE